MAAVTYKWVVLSVLEHTAIRDEGTTWPSRGDRGAPEAPFERRR